MKKSDDGQLIDTIQAEYNLQLSRPAEFQEGIDLRVRRHGHYRRLALTVGLFVFGLAVVFGTGGTEGDRKSHLVVEVETEAARDAGELWESDELDWWESESEDDEGDEVYPEEFQALALLIIDPMYENRSFGAKGE